MLGGERCRRSRWICFETVSVFHYGTFGLADENPEMVHDTAITAITALIERQAVMDVITRLFLATERRIGRRSSPVSPRRCSSTWARWATDPPGEYRRVRSSMAGKRVCARSNTFTTRPGTFPPDRGGPGDGVLLWSRVPSPSQSERPEHPSLRRKLQLRARKARRRLADHGIPFRPEVSRRQSSPRDELVRDRNLALAIAALARPLYHRNKSAR
jgi:hypothetical protein